MVEAIENLGVRGKIGGREKEIEVRHTGQALMIHVVMIDGCAGVQTTGATTSRFKRNQSE